VISLETPKPDPVAEIDKIIAGVLPRRVILRTLLLQGPKTGHDLRIEMAEELFRNQAYWTLKDSFDRRINGVSDALLYFNLKQLEISGLIIRERSEEQYKSKVARINPRKIQQLRRYFRDITPLSCISCFSEEDEKHNLTRLYQKLRLTKLFQNQTIEEGKCFTVVPQGLKSKISGGIPKELILEISPKNMNYFGIIQFIREKIEDLLQTHEIIINVTTGSRFFTVVLTQLAFEYDLKMFYLDPEQDKIIWFKE
jgi:DNA-binding PadR family transcriptional regulator